MLVRNLQQKIHNCQEITYTFKMFRYSAEDFAKWLDNAFQLSSFKSYSDLADKVGLSRGTVSSYASARPQSTSNKASRPRRENVIKLASALKQDINEALLLAGHAPKDVEDTNGYFKGLDKLPLDKQKIAKRQIRAIIDALAEKEFTDEDFNYIDD